TPFAATSAGPRAGTRAGSSAGGEYYWAEVEPEDGIDDGLRVQAPFVLVWDETAQVQYPIARVRRGPEVGTLADAFLQPGFVLGVIDALRAKQELDGRDGGKPGDKPGIIRYLPEPGLGDIDFGTEPELQWIRAEQSNSSVIVGSQAILKLIRNVKPGVSPEVEVSRHLTRAGYANIPALLGEVVRVDADGVPHTLAVMHAFVNNEGDAWTWTLDYLKRTLGAAMLGGNSPEEFEASLEGYTVMAGTIGRRLAELHNALAQATDDPAFPVQTATADDAQAHATRIAAQLDRADEDLRAVMDRLEAPSHACAQWLFEHRDRLRKQVDTMAQALVGAPLIRVHGDFHLGQVLVAQTDAYLIDFEGEPIQTLEARRNITTPYKDVAGMLRSFDYAAASVARSDPMGGAPTDANAGAADSPAAPGVPQDLRDTLLARFGSRAAEAFLQGYQEAASTAIALPGAQEDTLLKLAQLEKAAYEVSYEAAHRPDWISIPLCALTGLARELLQDAAISAEEKTR
ncbi:putative maltokinase, partial [Achromobacter sp. AGC39]